ncbi:MAB_1171c family putative transporter [Streptomyces gamaensis]|uniref:MAB_1171c family putative transporter n=1 Tax=Streptomyces gamaensis TaxID=1763542 RepID=A0ABW0ZAQ2_9ACTN
MFQEPVIAMLIVGAIWKSVDLVRAPHDRMLRLLVVCLVLLAAGEILSFPEANRAVDAFTAVGVGKIVFNGIYMSGLGALILFFVSATRGTTSRYVRQLRLNVGLLAAVLTVLTAAMLVTPAATRGHTLSTPYMAEPAITCFYVVGNLYFVYAYLTSGLWAVRYARKATRHLAFGLQAMAFGLFGLTITAVNRLIWVYLRIHDPGSHQAFNTVNWSMTDGALGVVLLGVVYSAGAQLVAHSRSVMHHRRLYHELAPLWTALAAAYPELVLHREPVGSRRRRFRLRRTHARFYRRLIECRDGLVRLSPYLAQVAPQADLAHCPPDQLARYIAAALAVKPSSEDPDSGLSAARIALPSGNDLESEARELVSLSRAYSKGHREQDTDSH